MFKIAALVLTSVQHSVGLNMQIPTHSVQYILLNVQWYCTWVVVPESNDLGNGFSVNVYDKIGNRNCMHPEDIVLSCLPSSFTRKVIPLCAYLCL